jgi:hypothetical protein
MHIQYIMGQDSRRRWIDTTDRKDRTLGSWIDTLDRKYRPL